LVAKDPELQKKLEEMNIPKMIGPKIDPSKMTPEQMKQMQMMQQKLAEALKNMKPPVMPPMALAPPKPLPPPEPDLEERMLRWLRDRMSAMERLPWLRGLTESTLFQDFFEGLEDGLLSPSGDTERLQELLSRFGLDRFPASFDIPTIDVS